MRKNILFLFIIFFCFLGACQAQSFDSDPYAYNVESGSSIKIVWYDGCNGYVSDDFELRGYKTLYVMDENNKRVYDIHWTVSGNSNAVKLESNESNCNIAALKSGNVTVTATAPNGESDTINIKVNPAKNIKIVRFNTVDDYSNDFQFNGTKGGLAALDENGNNISGQVRWSSSDYNRVSVSVWGHTHVIKGTCLFLELILNGIGTVTITGELPNGFKTEQNITITPLKKITVARDVWNSKIQKYDKDPNDFIIENINDGVGISVFDEEGNDLPLTYSNDLERRGCALTIKSSDENILQYYFGCGGNFVAVGYGTAIITAKYKVGSYELTDSIKVTVGKPVPVESITLNKFSLSLDVNESEKLTATVLPNNADRSVTWKSSNKNVATVDDNGNIKAVKEGITYITVTAAGKDKNGKQLSASCKVTVSEPIIPVTGIKLSSASLALEVGKTSVLTATVLPENATDKIVTWKSSNKNVVTVDDNGNIKAVKEGITYITVTAAGKDKNGKQLSTSCKVTVKNIPVTGVKLDRTSVTMAVGETVPFSAKVLPENATNKDVEWRSDNTSVAKVNSLGQVKAYKKGTAKIYVRTKDGKFVASCKVTVKSVSVIGVKLDKTKITVSIGETAKLTATVLPENATNKDVEWRSDNTSVVKVNSKGEFKAYKAGTATVYVRTKDGKFVASCKVTVIEVNVVIVMLDKTKMTMKVGETETLTPVIYPLNASNKKVTWKSDNTKVAKVNSQGQVKAYKSGTAVITVISKDGGKTATCKVTVK